MSAEAPALFVYGPRDPMPVPAPAPAPAQEPSGSSNSKPELRDRLVSILANTANGCLAELGYYPGIVHRVRELEFFTARLHEDNVRLWEDNRNLAKKIHIGPIPGDGNAQVQEILRLRNEVVALVGERDELKRERKMMKALIRADPDTRLKELWYLQRKYCSAADEAAHLRGELKRLSQTPGRPNPTPNQANAVPAHKRSASEMGQMSGEQPAKRMATSQRPNGRAIPQPLDLSYVPNNPSQVAHNPLPTPVSTSFPPGLSISSVRSPQNPRFFSTPPASIVHLNAEYISPSNTPPVRISYVSHDRRQSVSGSTPVPPSVPMLPTFSPEKAQQTMQGAPRAVSSPLPRTNFIQSNGEIVDLTKDPMFAIPSAPGEERPSMPNERPTSSQQQSGEPMAVDEPAIDSQVAPAEGETETPKLPSLEECVDTVFEEVEDADGDAHVCMLCSYRYENQLTTEPPTLFRSASLDTLVAHCKTEHPTAWEQLRNTPTEVD